MPYFDLYVLFLSLFKVGVTTETEVCYRMQTGLELMILLPPFPKWWDRRPVLPCPVGTEHDSLKYAKVISIQVLKCKVKTGDMQGIIFKGNVILVSGKAKQCTGYFIKLKYMQTIFSACLKYQTNNTYFLKCGNFQRKDLSFFSLKTDAFWECENV